jgi:hypothetical protein
MFLERKIFVSSSKPLRCPLLSLKSTGREAIPLFSELYYIRRHIVRSSRDDYEGSIEGRSSVSLPKLHGPTACRYPVGIGITLSMESHAACMPIERSCRGNGTALRGRGNSLETERDESTRALERLARKRRHCLGGSSGWHDVLNPPFLPSLSFSPPTWVNPLSLPPPACPSLTRLRARTRTARRDGRRSSHGADFELSPPLSRFHWLPSPLFLWTIHSAATRSAVSSMRISRSEIVAK